MGFSFRAILFALLLFFNFDSGAAAGSTPYNPGVYLKLKNGFYTWLPPISCKPGYETSREVLLPYRTSGCQHGLQLLDIGHVLLAPTVDFAEIDSIVINARDENLQFLFSLAFADEYLQDESGEPPMTDKFSQKLLVTKWGFSRENFSLQNLEGGMKSYGAKNSNAYFTSYTYPQSRIGENRIIDVGRVIATNRGYYLFNTTGSLSNFLWNIRINKRQADITEMGGLVRKLERVAIRFNEWGTLAWTYKDRGNREKAIAIYREKVIPQTVTLNEDKRKLWQEYFEAIKK